MCNAVLLCLEIVLWGSVNFNDYRSPHFIVNYQQIIHLIPILYKRKIRGPISTGHTHSIFNIQQSLLSDKYVCAFVLACVIAFVLAWIRSSLALAKSHASSRGAERFEWVVWWSFSFCLATRRISALRANARFCLRMRCAASRCSTLSAFSRVRCSFRPCRRSMSSVTTRVLCDVTDEEYDMLSVTWNDVPNGEIACHWNYIKIL